MQPIRLLPALGRCLVLAALLTACASTATSTTSQSVRATSRTVYYHTAIAAGPTLITRSDGTLLEERRNEPFGAAIDAGASADPHNALNKETDALTGWSDHGARWLAVDTARWLTPDPPVKGPDPKLLSRPDGLHPYQYVAQNPILFWDPDGKDAYRTEWLEDQRRYAAEARQRQAAATAAIGG